MRHHSEKVGRLNRRYGLLDDTACEALRPVVLHTLRRIMKFVPADKVNNVFQEELDKEIYKLEIELDYRPK